MATKEKEPKMCIRPADSAHWYVYTTELVDTSYGPERKIRLSKDGDWQNGPVVTLQECMTEDAIVKMAIHVLNEE